MHRWTFEVILFCIFTVILLLNHLILSSSVIDRVMVCVDDDDLDEDDLDVAAGHEWGESDY